MEEYPDPIIEDCTCDHEPEKHTWGSCEVEGCKCKGGWTE